ncbi:large neutral amino acids transporter small subunit 2 [Columba livia]|uniref:large neutral amino acids transporter small subunit 2 n=1 Tax=Columba livia TaxID=8932 RepID=UPI0031BAF3CC
MMEGARQRGVPPVKGEHPQKGGVGGDEEGGVALKKEIGLLSACGVIVGNIIGSGIFVSPRGVLEQTGSVGLSLLVWGGAGVVTAGGALCYAELGLAVPRPGGDYAYVMEAFGGLVGFLRLWLLVLVIFPTTQAVIALTFASYLLHPFSPAPCHSPDPALDTALRLLAAACVVLLTGLNWASVVGATRLQDACAAAKLGAIGLVIVTGLVRIAQGKHFWLDPPQAFPGEGVAGGAWPGAGPLALAFLQGSFAYGGWNFLNYLTDELIDPPRNLPRAIFISLPLVTLVYVLANVAYLTAMSPQELLQSQAVAVTFGEKALGRALAWVMPLGVALATFGGVNGSLFTCSRLFYAGARERQLPALLAMIHLERRTPGPALLVTCLSTLLMLGAGDVTALVSYVGFVNHLWYGVAVAALLVLRRRDPHKPRPFRVPTVLPVLYLLLWGWLGGAALLREPLLCGLGLGVSLLPAPLYLLAMRGKGPRLPALRRACDAVTHFGQRLFLVVYPQPSPQGDDPTTHSDDLTPHGDNPMTHSDDPAPHSNPWQPLTSQPHS